MLSQERGKCDRLRGKITLCDRGDSACSRLRLDRLRKRCQPPRVPPAGSGRNGVIVDHGRVAQLSREPAEHRPTAGRRSLVRAAARLQSARARRYPSREAAGLRRVEIPLEGSHGERPNRADRGSRIQLHAGLRQLGEGRGSPDPEVEVGLVVGQNPGQGLDRGRGRLDQRHQVDRPSNKPGDGGGVCFLGG